MKSIGIFGEVLFDCFPSGETVRGGAPFNVAWHVQALGDHPVFISRVGEDELGEKILDSMQSWGMDRTAVQRDPVHPTGQVDIEIVDGEPRYTITPDVAYDFIDAAAVPALPEGSILYHGSLCLRNPVSRSAFDRLARSPGCSIFLDVNLRAPWWRKEEVWGWLDHTRWAKMNEDEMHELGFSGPDVRANMEALQDRFGVEQLIVTRGKSGALVRTRTGEFYEAPADLSKPVVDSVGAGDGFSGVYLHGLLAGWPVDRLLHQAQEFAGEIVGLRGATPQEASFYADVWADQPA